MGYDAIGELIFVGRSGLIQVRQFMNKPAGATIFPRAEKKYQVQENKSGFADIVVTHKFEITLIYNYCHCYSWTAKLSLGGVGLESVCPFHTHSR